MKDKELKERFGHNEYFRSALDNYEPQPEMKFSHVFNAKIHVYADELNWLNRKLGAFRRWWIKLVE